MDRSEMWFELYHLLRLAKVSVKPRRTLLTRSGAPVVVDLVIYDHGRPRLALTIKGPARGTRRKMPEEDRMQRWKGTRRGERYTNLADNIQAMYVTADELPDDVVAEIQHHLCEGSLQRSQFSLPRTPTL
jgi:hypothetical protein